MAGHVLGKGDLDLDGLPPCLLNDGDPAVVGEGYGLEQTVCTAPRQAVGNGVEERLVQCAAVGTVMNTLPA